MSAPVIAMQCNYAYLDKLFTSLKSLLYHNNGLKIYILNPDIPQEWFKNVNQQLSSIGDNIIDLKVDQSGFGDSQISFSNRLNTMTFNKLLLPRLLPEEKVLYLDSDVIINHSITALLNLDFSEPLAAVKDLNSPDSEINAGVVYFNNPVINQHPKIVDQVFPASKQPGLRTADESVLSTFFYHQAKFLPRTYNYEVGVEGYAVYHHIDRIISELARISDPAIIHFDSDDKPWNLLSTVRYRELWWYYNGMSIRDIIDHVTLGTNKPRWSKLRGPLFCLTNSQDFSHLTELVTTLSDYQFEIAARTSMGPKLVSLLKYPNVRLYQGILPQVMADRLNCAKAYLDVNQGMKDTKVIRQFLESGKPVLAFNNTMSMAGNDQYLVFADDQVKKMADWIRTID